MNFHVITLFPEMIIGATQYGVLGQALKADRLTLRCLSPRAFTHNVHQSVDDRPFGGGDGMVMLAEPMAQAIEQIHTEIGQRHAQEGRKDRLRKKTVHLSPRGVPLSDGKLREYAQLDDLVLIASRYAGLDQRCLNTLVDEEVSLGDYVLSGGEIATLAVIDGVARLIPGVLGNETSAASESFAPGLGLLEQPQYTRPREWRGLGLPSALLSGNHALIAEWNLQLSILVTASQRPELLKSVPPQSLAQARVFLEKLSDDDSKLCGLKDRQTLLERLQSVEVRPVPFRAKDLK